MNFMGDFISIHYNEIALKGRNRGRFEGLLIKNIAKRTGFKPEKLNGRLILKEYNQDTINILRLMPGIAWFGKSFTIERDLDVLINTLKNINSIENYDIDIRRIDKSFKYTSLDVKEEILKRIKTYKKGNKIIIEIFDKFFVITKDITEGIGGLPVGSAGKVISLFSGGIDSSIVPIELMKRGCTVDLLHVYASPSIESIIDSKIDKIVKYLSKINPIKLYLIPFSLFSLKTMEVEKGYDLILFKRFLLKLAENIAYKFNYKAIATGDSLSQVASQTLSNISAINYGIDIPILRPLITYNKQEIINKAIRYGTYELSIEKYKDCCSLVAKHPNTNSNINKLKEIEEKVKLNNIIDESIEKMKVIKYK